MLARVINNGHQRVYPTCIGDLRIPKGQEYMLDNTKAIKELQAYRELLVEVIEPDEEGKFDYSLYPVNQLRNIASQAGILNSFFMKKVDLIKILEEKNESTI